MIPMVDLSKLFAARGNIRVTVVTTAANAPLVEPSIRTSPHTIHLLTLPFPSSVAANVTDLPTPDFTPAFVEAIDSLTEPFNRLLVEHRPDCIVSDVFYPWSADLACEHNIPRVAFHGSSAFSITVMIIIGAHKPRDSPFVVPSIPHRIEMVQSQLPGAATEPDDMIVRILEAQKRTYGTIMNTCVKLEAGYAERLRGRAWLVGPVSLCNRNLKESATRGGQEVRNYNDCMNWLDAKSPGSVIYVCFGSLGRFTIAQRREIAAGLLDSGRPFMWVVRSTADDGNEWMPDGLERKGLIVRGWAPQMAILSHSSVGGFMTHCGWNSCLEGLTAGVPMVTWPQFAEQFFNERLLVDVLRVGASVGAMVCSGAEEKRTLVKGEVAAKAVNEVMGDGEEADGRRKRAKEAAAMARAAMEDGGSSYMGLSKVIQELIDVKKGKDLRLESNVTS